MSAAPPAPNPDDLFSFGDIVLDAATIFGSTTPQACDRVRRCVNRAMIAINKGDRRWTWLQQVLNFTTVSGVRTYTLDQSVKKLHHMWITGLSRQRIDRIPTTKFVELVPNPTLASGIPRLFDEEGVDSNGAMVVSLYPMPADLYPINYRFTARAIPISEDSTDVRGWWGIPDNLIEPLIQKAAALACQGVNNAKFLELNANAELLIADEYASDQAKPQTSYRSPMGDEWNMISDGPMLPPTYGNW